MTTTRPATETRRTLEDFDELREQREKLSDLQSQRRELQAAIDKEYERLQKLKRESTVPVDGMTLEALALLDGTIAKDEYLDVSAANRQVQIFQRAIQIQEDRVAKLLSAAQREIRSDYLPEHKRLKARLLAAGEQLAAAVAEEAQFRDELFREGVDFGSPLEALGNPKLFGIDGERGALVCWIDEQLRQTYSR